MASRVQLASRARRQDTRWLVAAAVPAALSFALVSGTRGRKLRQKLNERVPTWDEFLKRIGDETKAKNGPGTAVVMFLGAPFFLSERPCCVRA